MAYQIEPSLRCSTGFQQRKAITLYVQLLILTILTPTTQQTVVFDCCHSGSGTRTGGIDPTRLVRMVDIPSYIPANIDQDIWRAFGSNRGTKFAPGFLQSGLMSHVLLTACDSMENAREEGGRGIFTKAFLEVLISVGVDKLTYTDVLKRIPALPG